MTDAHTVTRCYISHIRIVLSPWKNHHRDFRSKIYKINRCAMSTTTACASPLAHSRSAKASTQTTESFRLVLPKRKYIEHRVKSWEPRAGISKKLQSSLLNTLRATLGKEIYGTWERERIVAKILHLNNMPQNISCSFKTSPSVC